MKTANGLRAALYARVSTSQQEEEATIESQIAAVETYAKTAGYELEVAHYYLTRLRLRPTSCMVSESASIRMAPVGGNKKDTV